MYVYLDDTLQLGVDCVAMVTPTRAVIYGWSMAPRGVAPELSLLANGTDECPVVHSSFHPRKDVVPADPRAAEASGFTLLAEVPEDATALELTLAAGPLLLRVDLLDKRVETNLFKATADRDWDATYGLLRLVTGDATLAGLLRYQGRPFGGFAEWLGRIPVLRGRDQAILRIAEAEAMWAPSGEALVMLRMPGILPRDATVDAVAIGWLRTEDDLAEPMVLPLAEEYGVRQPAALGLYVRVDPAVLNRLHALELIVRAQQRPGDSILLRCQLASVTVPGLLDGACRTIADALALPVEAPAAAGLELLREVIARREAAFRPTLAALASPPRAAAGGGLPRLGLILGVDDPAAARLFHVTADAFERRCDTVLVMGAAADEVVQALARRGSLAVLTGVEAAAALRDATGRAGVLAIDAASFAEAVIAGTPEAAFAHPLEASETARLLALHAVAGCAPALTDSLQRLLRMRRERPNERGFAPVQRPWSNRHAADLVNSHLQRLWTAGTRAAEPANA